MVKTGKRQVRRAGPATDRVRRLEDKDRGAVARKLDGGSEAVWAAPDDDSVQACRQGGPLCSRSGSDDFAACQHHPILTDSLDATALELLLVHLGVGGHDR